MNEDVFSIQNGHFPASYVCLPELFFSEDLVFQREKTLQLDETLVNLNSSILYSRLKVTRNSWKSSRAEL